MNARRYGIICVLLGVASGSGCTDATLGGSRFLNATTEDGTPGSIAASRGLAVDASGNAYITGPVTGNGMDGNPQIGIADYFVSKYSPNGLREWTIEDGAAGGSIVLPGNATAADASGNTYVAGETSKGLDGHPHLGTQDLFLTKYDTGGVLQWTVEDGVAAGTTIAQAVIVDPSSNVYICGRTTKGIDGHTVTGTEDLIVSKYDTNGNRQWTVEDGVSSVTTEAWALALDPSGNLFVAGRISSGLTGVGLDGQPSILQSPTPNNGINNLFLAKYDTNGNRQWTVQDGTSAGPKGQNVFSIATDSSGNVYVSGDTGAPGLDGNTLTGVFDLFVSKYSPSGARQWTVEDGTAGATTSTFAVAVDSLGNIDVAGSIFAMRGAAHGRGWLLADRNTRLLGQPVWLGGDPQLDCRGRRARHDVRRKGYCHGPVQRILCIRAMPGQLRTDAGPGREPTDRHWGLLYRANRVFREPRTETIWPKLFRLLCNQPDE